MLSVTATFRILSGSLVGRMAVPSQLAGQASAGREGGGGLKPGEMDVINMYK